MERAFPVKIDFRWVLAHAVLVDPKLERELSALRTLFFIGDLRTVLTNSGHCLSPPRYALERYAVAVENVVRRGAACYGSYIDFLKGQQGISLPRDHGVCMYGVLYVLRTYV